MKLTSFITENLIRSSPAVHALAVPWAGHEAFGHVPQDLAPLLSRGLRLATQVLVVDEVGVARVVVAQVGVVRPHLNHPAVLIGLVLNGLFGWAWADSIAALVVAGLAIREGIEAWRGDIESPFEVLEDLDHDDHEEVTP